MGLFLARVGELCPPGEPGRGKKKPTSTAEVFHPHTLTDYRKLHRYQAEDEKIDEYFEAVASRVFTAP